MHSIKDIKPSKFPRLRVAGGKKLPFIFLPARDKVESKRESSKEKNHKTKMESVSERIGKKSIFTQAHYSSIEIKLSLKMREFVTTLSLRLANAWIHLTNSSDVLDQYMAFSPALYNESLRLQMKEWVYRDIFTLEATIFCNITCQGLHSVCSNIQTRLLLQNLPLLLCSAGILKIYFYGSCEKPICSINEKTILFL